eukprot:CAMPEP_0195509942 /NCGR_PEP_ID=MMETSP0794_2-20130614/2732_1 /TAXON_ID=515487 /ORGANISM="Stephanopyxis turris, Strain CCMP 815" /LENGTH=138 /DNA_ID=CAMNT_0040637277 /DNA_START=84 /DNA_END=496 /DNA_ORIENTATION=+
MTEAQSSLNDPLVYKRIPNNEDHQDVTSSEQEDFPEHVEVRSVEGVSTLETFAGVAGNLLEWYDFALYGFFSDVLGDVFFPPQRGHSAIAKSFLIFGSGFIMRPVGGLIMGYIGDTYGRKQSLVTSIMLMMLTTVIMG